MLASCLYSSHSYSIDLSYINSYVTTLIFVNNYYNNFKILTEVFKWTNNELEFPQILKTDVLAELLDLFDNFDNTDLLERRYGECHNNNFRT